MRPDPVPRCHGMVMEPVPNVLEWICHLCGARLGESDRRPGRVVLTPVETDRDAWLGPRRSARLNPLVQMDQQIREEENR